jgi:MFS family permease
MPLGTIASFAITGSYFANTEGNRKEQFQNLIQMQNTISFVIFVAFIAIYKEQPDLPPSSVALQKPPRVDLLSAIKGFLTNRNYLMLTLSFSLTQGLFAAIGTLLSSIFDPLGVDPARISLLGGILLVSGMLSAPLVGIFLDRTGKYVLTVRVLSVLLAASICLALFSVQRIEQDFDLMMLNMAICGACAVAYIPATLALANELTFPLQPAASVGLMNIGGSIFAFNLGIFGTWMTTVDPNENRVLSQEEINQLSIHYSIRTLRMFAVCAIVASSFLFAVTEDLRRL